VLGQLQRGASSLLLCSKPGGESNRERREAKTGSRGWLGSAELHEDESKIAKQL
jgi:hypothetical protein